MGDGGPVRILKWDSDMFRFVCKSVRNLAALWQVDGGRWGHCHSLKQLGQCQKRNYKKWSSDNFATDCGEGTLEDDTR